MLSTSVGEKQGTIKKHLGAPAEHSGGGVVIWDTYRTGTFSKCLHISLQNRLRCWCFDFAESQQSTCDTRSAAGPQSRHQQLIIGNRTTITKEYSGNIS